MQMSAAKRRLSGPARTLMTSLRHSKVSVWTLDSRRCGAFDRMNIHKKLSCREGTARCVVSVEICQLPRNSAETTCTTSPEQIEVMKLKRYSKAMCNKHVHSTMTRWSRIRCPVGVINKPTTVELWISPVYRRRAVAKFSKSTM